MLWIGQFLPRAEALCINKPTLYPQCTTLRVVRISCLVLKREDEEMCDIIYILVKYFALEHAWAVMLFHDKNRMTKLSLPEQPDLILNKMWKYGKGFVFALVFTIQSNHVLSGIMIWVCISL